MTSTLCERSLLWHCSMLAALQPRLDRLRISRVRSKHCKRTCVVALRKQMQTFDGSSGLQVMPRLSWRVACSPCCKKSELSASAYQQRISNLESTLAVSIPCNGLTAA
jgi:hypothetical protein